jgi:hypothetical protein
LCGEEVLHGEWAEEKQGENAVCLRLTEKNVLAAANVLMPAPERQYQLLMKRPLLTSTDVQSAEDVSRCVRRARFLRILGLLPNCIPLNGRCLLGIRGLLRGAVWEEAWAGEEAGVWEEAPVTAEVGEEAEAEEGDGSKGVNIEYKRELSEDKRRNS